MKKKQLITSLAVTGVMMGSMVGNAFADDAVTTAPTTTTPTVTETATNETATNTYTATYTAEDGNVVTKDLTNEPVVVGTLGGELDAILKDSSILKNNSTLEDSSVMRCNTFLGRKLSINIETGSPTHTITHKYKELEHANDPSFYNIKDILKIQSPDGEDSFVVKVHTNIKEGKKGHYKVLASFKDNQVTFTVITLKGTTLGHLSDCQNIIDSKISISSGKSTLLDVSTFHYSYIDHGQRDINIYVDEKSSVSADQESVAPQVEESAQ